MVKKKNIFFIFIILLLCNISNYGSEDNLIWTPRLTNYQIVGMTHSDTRLFVSTDNGIFILDSDMAIVDKILDVNYAQDLIYYNGALFFYTVDTGVFYYRSETDSFILESGLFSGVINDIEIYDNNIFIATSNGGIKLYSLQGPTLIYTYNISDGLMSNNVTSVKVNSDYIVIGYADKGISYRHGSDTYIHFNTNNSDIISDEISKLSFYDSNLLITSYGNGISFFDINGNSFQNYNTANSDLLTNKIRTILGYENKLYIGSEQGISILDILKGTWYNKYSDSVISNDIFNNKIIFGTTEGLYFTDYIQTPYPVENEEIKITVYPNPFNPDCERCNFYFYIQDDFSVDIDIYDLNGSLIKSVVKDGSISPYYANKYYWNGKDESNNICSIGTVVSKILLKHGDVVIKRRVRYISIIK